MVELWDFCNSRDSQKIAVADESRSFSVVKKAFCYAVLIRILHPGWLDGM